MGVILTLLSSFYPYIAGAIGLIVSYFWIKNKGVQQERDKQAAEKAEAVIKVTQKVQEAVQKDQEVSKRVQDDIQKLKTSVQSDKPSDPTKFRF